MQKTALCNRLAAIYTFGVFGNSRAADGEAVRLLANSACGGFSGTIKIKRCSRAKTLLVMKLTSLFIVLGLLNAQANGVSQTITFSGKDMSLSHIFPAIKKQTGFVVFYTKDMLTSARPVSVQAQQMPLDLFLETILEGQQLDFKIGVSSIFISPRESGPIPVSNTGMGLPDPPQMIRGVVRDANGKPVRGASVVIKSIDRGTATDEQGMFALPNIPEGNYLIEISSIGFEWISAKVTVTGRPLILSFTLMPDVREQQDLVVTTGYEKIPKERSTGSFSSVTNRQLEQRPTAHILDRLEGFAGGLVFHRNSVDKDPKLVIRGRSTIYSNDQPLYVVDGFPIESDISNINPNDVESITILKDAAASSIWGVRAANGVVVVITKKGSFNQKPVIQLRSHVMISKKPDLFYLPFMSTSDYVDLEKSWFDQGRYDSYFNTPPDQRQPLSQVIETLFNVQNGSISNEQGTARLNKLRSIDIRKEYTDEFYRNRVQQQNVLNIQGGSDKIRYFFSSGYDKELSAERGNQSDRITIRSDNTIKLHPKLDLSVAVNLAWTKDEQNALGLFGLQGENSSSLGSALTTQYAFNPYQELRDEQGNAVVAPRNYTTDYNEYLQGLGMEDWSYRPADEIKFRDNTTTRQNTRIALGLEYRLFKNLTADLKYQYEGSYSNNKDLHTIGSYYARDIVNVYTQFVGDSSNPTHHVPVGGVLLRNIGKQSAHTFRGQLNFLEDWKHSRHVVAAIAGMEIRDIMDETSLNSYYGYNDRTLLFVDINKSASYPQFGQMFSLPFMFGGGVMDELKYIQNRYASFYANASYTYDHRYVVSASGRIDKSSLFGVKPKDRNVPLWSIGTAWNIHQESFFRDGFLSRLKLRATYGFNGNVSPEQSAYPIAYTSNDPMTQLPTATITNPANPLLQWEKVAQTNIGVDFTVSGNKLSGSVEWFSKAGKDLQGDHFLDPSSGFATIRANVASMRGTGFDIELNYRTGDVVSWDSRLIFSHATDKVTAIALANSTNMFGGTQNYIQADNSLFPLLNRPVYSVYSYRWAGLDNEGNPRLYDEKGEIGDYATILNSLPPGDLVYNGPAQPTFFGGWNNSISWNGFSLSATVTYKFGHKFRRSSINYYGLNSGGIFHATGHSDYAMRWQQPGDEFKTQVPSNPGYSSYDYNRDEAYRFSDILVEDASHIRLKDITLSYNLPAGFVKKGSLRSVQLYLYFDNVGLLWRANKHGLDPDFVPMAYSNYLPMPLSCTGGIKIEL